MPVKRLPIGGQQLKGLQERIKTRSLAEADYELLQGLAEAVECLSQALAEKDTSIGRLCKYLFGAPTETAKNILKHHNRLPAQQKDQKTKSNGHGRVPASAYEAAGRIHIEHPSLKPGHRCPGCEKGKLYELSMPSVFVHITGQAPLKGTVYERMRLRCNLCGEILTPELPAELGDKKHDESAAAMLAVLKYGCGLPLHRLGKLQARLLPPRAGLHPVGHPGCFGAHTGPGSRCPRSSGRPGRAHPQRRHHDEGALVAQPTG